MKKIKFSLVPIVWATILAVASILFGYAMIFLWNAFKNLLDG